jgi:prepilin-type N-terminal cleavage/methylation domain-containing protein
MTINIRKEKSGFTVIEVMIVLAIAALIMLLVFEGLSELRKSYRDHDRKSYAADVLAATNEYYKNNKRLPFCTDRYSTRCSTVQDDASKFITDYLPKGSDPLTGKSWNSTAAQVGAISGENAAGNTITFCNPAASNPEETAIYCAEDRAVRISHQIYPKVGQLVIVENHLCCPCEVGPDYTGYVDGNNIHHGKVPTNPDGTRDLSAYDLPDTLSIIMGTERGRYYCVDNSNSNRY